MGSCYRKPSFKTLSFASAHRRALPYLGDVWADNVVKQNVLCTRPPLKGKIAILAILGDSRSKFCLFFSGFLSTFVEKWLIFS